MRTLRQLAQEALDVQNACNPLGLSRSYAEALSDLFENRRLPASTGDVCSHPINRLWASKLHDLAGMGISDTDRYGEAHRACQALAAGEGEAVAA